MKTGNMLIAAGIILFLYAAFVFDTSVEATGFGANAETGNRIINIGLQQRQMMLAMAGLALFLAGIINDAASWLADALKQISLRSGPVAATATSDRPSPDPAREDQELARIGISRDGDAYLIGNNRYKTKEDAMATARFRAP
jgi:hypothetical protein